MKKTINVFARLLVCISLFSACNGVGGRGTPTIIGTWDIGSTQYIFTDDGKFSEKDPSQNKIIATGTYTYANATLTIIKNGAEKAEYFMMVMTAKEGRFKPILNGKISKDYLLWKKVHE